MEEDRVILSLKNPSIVRPELPRFKVSFCAVDNEPVEAVVKLAPEVVN